MWLGWLTDSAKYQCRGYFPNVADIPADYRDKSKWNSFFKTESVRGIRRIDFRAVELSRRFPEQIRIKEWEMKEPHKKYLLEFICWIPSGRDGVFDGEYSWNPNNPKEHNCSSWVVKKINDVMGNNFINCPQPKKLESVINHIFNGTK